MLLLRHFNIHNEARTLDFVSVLSENISDIWKQKHLTSDKYVNKMYM